jgi:hypothetical protein
MSAFALTREERALARVSKDEATELENAPGHDGETVGIPAQVSTMT